MAEGSNTYESPDSAVERETGEIRDDIEGTRSSLTDKLETLEERVKGTVEAAQQTVEQTIATVKESVQDTVQSVKRSVDIRHHVEQRPWITLGASVAAGYLLGSIRSGRKAESAASQPMANGHGNGFHSLSAMTSAPPTETIRRKKHVSHRPSMKTRFLHQFEDELATLEKVAIGGVMGMLRDWLKQSMPSVAPQLEQVMNSAASKLGGEPIAATAGSQRFTQYGSS